MKILLITHKIDIDGMGSAVLANLVFDDLKIEYCDTFEIDNVLNFYIESGKISVFDKVFVTDLCPSQNMLNTISNSSNLTKKISIFDHHITDIQKNKYDYVLIIDKNEHGKCCGTSLFLDHLKNNYDFKTNPAIETFVELTRQYDTWEWKTKYNNTLPNDLSILFSSVGIDNYVLMLSNKLKLLQNFEFSNDELKLISDKKAEITKACKELKAKLQIINFENLVIGVVYDKDGKYRNEFAEFLKEKKANIDVMLMLNKARNTASFRAINSAIDVGSLAVRFGGKGHKASGGCPLSNELLTTLKLSSEKN